MEHEGKARNQTMMNLNASMHFTRNRRRRVAWMLYPILLVAASLCWCLNLFFLARISAVKEAIGEKGSSRQTLLVPKSRPTNVFLSSRKPNNNVEFFSNRGVGQNNATSYAYAWVMGGIHEDRPAYKGFLYDILISVNLLKTLGSKADFWVWIQMSPDSALDELPQDDTKLLQALGVRIRQLDKPTTQSFASLVYDKFRTLQMTNYKRVMFLDADIIPLVNLDYLFHLSDPDELDSPTVLRPNLIMASRREPCNTGMFMVEPAQGAWESLQQVIQKQHESAQDLPYPHFDFRNGWGHNFILEGDYWEGFLKKGTRWRFHAGHSDHGLMYYYAKYVRQDVSIVIGDRLQNWLPDGKQKLPRKVFDVTGALAGWSPTPLAYQSQCNVEPRNNILCFSPYRDVAHFMGSDKPWQQGVTRVNKHFEKHKNSTWAKFAPHRLWFQELEALNDKYSMGLDIKSWDEVHLAQMRESPLGYMAMYKDQIQVIQGEEHQK